MARFNAFGRIDHGVGLVRPAVASVIHAHVFMVFQEESARQNIIGPIIGFLRQDILTNNKFHGLEAFDETRGVGFAMEHRAASHNERAHRIGLTGLGRFKCRPQRTDAFRIKELVHGLAWFDFPGDASRSRALCAGLLDARAAHTGTLRHDKAAFAVHLTGKEIDEAHQLVGFDVIAVARRIPAVVARRD